MSRFTEMVKMLFRRSSSRSAVAKSVRRAHTSFRPSVELLEDRVVPYTVTNLLNSGAGSLRDGLAGNDPTIVFASSLNGTISLVDSSGGPLSISNTLADNWTITADPSVNAITISG